MGVDLGGLLPGEPVTLEQLAGKTLAVDAYNTLYQFLAIIRGPDGTPLRDSHGRVTSHLSGLLNRTANVAVAGVGTVFVFDGAPHPLKTKVLQARSEVRKKAQRDYDEAIAEGDLERARSKAQQTSTLSKEMVEQAKRLLAAFGFPIIQAPSEGEAQASFMAREGHVYAAASQDFDSLLFGAPQLVRNLSITGRRKMPGRQAFVDVTPEKIALDAGLQAAGLTREQLIDVAILVGTDFNPGVSGIGPKTAVKMITEHVTLEGALEHAGGMKGAGGKRLLEGREGLGDVGTIRKLFLEPTVAKDVVLRWGGLDREAVFAQLVDEHEFSRERVATALDKLASSPLYRRQRSILDPRTQGGFRTENHRAIGTGRAWGRGCDQRHDEGGHRRLQWWAGRATRLQWSERRASVSMTIDVGLFTVAVAGPQLSSNPRSGLEGAVARLRPVTVHTSNESAKLVPADPPVV